MTKDFEAIYLLTPTNLLQRLSFDSEEKYKHLSNYLFQQEYLFKNGYLTRPQAIRNIANGFRQTFWGETNASFTQNGDLYLHTLKVVIQAIGRICRCRNKNKQIYIYTDKEVVERIQSAMPTTEGKLLNPEFKELHSLNITATEISDKITQYSEQSKRAYGIITNAAYIKYLYLIHNTKTDKHLFPIGSTCINKFGRDDLNEEIKIKEGLFKLMHAILDGKRIELTSEYFSRKLLYALYEGGAFTDNQFNQFNAHNDYLFLLECFNKRDKSTITNRKSKKINSLIAYSIKPYLVRTLKLKKK